MLNSSSACNHVTVMWLWYANKWWLTHDSAMHYHYVNSSKVLCSLVLTICTWFTVKEANYSLAHSHTQRNIDVLEDRAKERESVKQRSRISSGTQQTQPRIFTVYNVSWPQFIFKIIFTITIDNFSCIKQNNYVDRLTLIMISSAFSWASCSMKRFMWLIWEIKNIKM